VPLYRHIADLAGNSQLVLPVPAFNVINGGSHAGNKLAMQEFMLLPTGVCIFCLLLSSYALSKLYIMIWWYALQSMMWRCLWHPSVILVCFIKMTEPVTKQSVVDGSLRHSTGQLMADLPQRCTSALFLGNSWTCFLVRVTIIFVVSVCLFVQSFSQPSLIRFRSNLDVCCMSGSSCVP